MSFKYHSPNKRSLWGPGGVGCAWKSDCGLFFVTRHCPSLSPLSLALGRDCGRFLVIWRCPSLSLLPFLFGVTRWDNFVLFKHHFIQLQINYYFWL